MTDTVERVSAMIRAAYLAGANAVHEEWMLRGALPITSHPEFDEAASDYCSSVFDPSNGWREIVTDQPPHETVVLLYWMDWRGSRYMEAGCASTGEQYSNGYSTMSFHGSATHWMPLPEPPIQPVNPLTGETLADTSHD